MAINQSGNSYQNLLSMLGQSTARSTASAASSEQNATASSKASVTDFSHYTDKVSLSHRAEKLQKISAEFFSGTISSAQIPELTQRLYEDGFLDSSDYQKLGGYTQPVSAISEAHSFLNRYILSESVDGDRATAQKLMSVVDVLANIDLNTTPELRQAEADAYEFIAGYTEQLQEQGASADTLEGFSSILDVLSALDKVRKQEQNTGALTSYASVQEAYDELFKDE